MKKRKKNRIELILISILFILSSTLIYYQVYDSYQDEEIKKEKEAEEYKINSYNKILDMFFLKSYMSRKYDLNGNIRRFSLEKKNNPLINYKLQNQLKEDYNFLGRSNSEFFIINTKRGLVIETNELNTVDNFSKEHG